MRTIKLKSNVQLKGGHLLPEIYKMIGVAFRTLPATIDDTLWITSANDGKHKIKSKHYTNQAFDIRIHNVISTSEISATDAIARWVKDIAIILGEKYDVVLEKDHIHLEYDPQ